MKKNIKKSQNSFLDNFSNQIPDKILSTYTIQGIIVQIIIIVFVLLFLIKFKTNILIQLFLISFNGIIPWLCIFFLLKSINKKTNIEPNQNDNKKIKTINKKNNLLIIQIIVSISGLLTGLNYILAGQINSFDLNFIIKDNNLSQGLNYNCLIFCGIMIFISLFCFKYFISLSKIDKTGCFKSAVHNHIFFLLILSLLCIDGILQTGSIQTLTVYIDIIIKYACILIGAEILIWTFLDIYRPKNQDNWILPFESRIISIIIQPKQISNIFVDSLDHQLGFQASELISIKRILTFSSIFLFCSIMLIWSFSTILIVESDQQALIIRFGKMNKNVINPGLYFKLPWPIEKTILYNVKKLRKIHVGSHKIDYNKNEVFQPDIPILWTNIHGNAQEELMIISSPQSIEINNANKIPSVSLFGSDIYLEYIISDLLQYVSFYKNPDIFLEQIAMQAVSNYLFRFDIDILLASGRGKMSNDLKENINQIAHESKSGLCVIHLGFSGVHPPQQVAQAFHESVSAIQYREMQIQKAYQYQAKILSETVGNASDSFKLIELVNNLEKNQSVTEKNKIKHNLQQYINNAQGKISVLLDLAKSYRWNYENREKGRVKRFSSQYESFKASPKMYCIGNYLSALSLNIQKAKKYLILCDNKKLLLRVNDDTAKLPPDIYYPKVRDPDEIDQ